MKVGIITFHHTTNFGATLQAYGLWQAIKNQGHEVEIIDYRPALATKYYRSRIINPIIMDFKSNLIWFKILIKYLFPSLCKYIRMRLFIISKLKLSNQKFVTQKQLRSFLESEADYDAVVCGSDQIWCIDSIRGYDTSYFLDFTNKKCCKLSYAASFGSTSNLGENYKYINKLIKDFDTITVRDSNSLNFIQQNCSGSAVKVLDPTFLINYSKSFELNKKPRFKPYLLLYVENSLHAEEVDFIRFIAQKRNLIIISIGDPYYVADKKIVNVSPICWLRYLNHASYVVTTFYHGTIFSIKFKKQFTTFARKHKFNKTGDLLNDLCLNNRFMSDFRHNSFKEQLIKIDYDIIDEMLEDRIAKSQGYLSNALNVERPENRGIVTYIKN